MKLTTSKMSANVLSSRSLIGNMAIGTISLLSAAVGYYCPPANAAILYEADYGTGNINKIDTVTKQIIPFYVPPTGVQSGPNGFAFDGQGNLYVSDYHARGINRISGDGKKAIPVVTGIDIAYGLAFDKQGNLYVTDAAILVDPNVGPWLDKTGRIIKITPQGESTVLSDGLQFPVWLTFDAQDNLYASEHDGGNQINRIDMVTGKPTPFATGLLGPFALAFDKDGYLFEADEDSKSIKKISPDGTEVKTFATGFEGPFGLAFDPDGNLFATDYIRGTLSQISADGQTVETIVSGLNQPRGIIFAPAISATTTAVPEPFTIVGTLIGGTAALRMRKKLKDGNKV